MSDSGYQISRLMHCFKMDLNSCMSTGLSRVLLYILTHTYSYTSIYLCVYVYIYVCIMYIHALNGLYSINLFFCMHSIAGS